MAADYFNFTPGDSGMGELFHKIVRRALEKGATDVHLEPAARGMAVRFRVDGLLLAAGKLTAEVALPLVSAIKILSGMDIAQSRLPQDGRATVSNLNREIDIRVSTQPTIEGERMVLRLLDRHGPLLDLSSLGFSGNNMQKILKMMNGNGLLLITGPTGSGKTTTMYAMLNNLKNGYRNIMTVEDPVEYVLEGISQTQINVRAGLDFAVGLRAVLRQDPDIIMVGEIRDRETADLAVRAAGTGHLVLSTLHTGDAAGALTRLLEMGIEPYRVASSVLGAVAQRLCRVTCNSCGGVVGKQSNTIRSRYDRGDWESADPGMCGNCGGTGYHGQTGIQEVLVVADDIRDLLGKNSSSRLIMDAAVKQGMATLFEDGMEKAARGLISIEEIKRVTGKE